MKTVIGNKIIVTALQDPIDNSSCSFLHLLFFWSNSLKSRYFNMHKIATALQQPSGFVKSATNSDKDVLPPTLQPPTPHPTRASTIEFNLCKAVSIHGVRMSDWSVSWWGVVLED